MVASTDFMAANLHVTAYDFDPDGTDAVDVGWVDMQGYSHILVMFFRTIGTSALDTFAILGNDASDGSGTDATLVTHAVASEPNAVGDYIFLECSEELMAENSQADLRYVSASCEFATGTDEGVVVYIRYGKRQYDALTADVIA